LTVGNPADDVSVTTWKLIMKQSINFSAFVDAFHAHNRFDSFGYDGLRVIFDFFEQYEEETGADVELDVIAICCDYNLEHYTDIASNYSIDLSAADGDTDAEEQIVMDYLNDNTMVLGQCKDGIVYQVF
jgi:hypothetical protein